MGSSVTKEQKKISPRLLTTNGHQSNRRTFFPRLSIPIHGETELWNNYEPLRCSYLETELGLYDERQNHLENARQRMRGKGTTDVVSRGLSTSLVTGEEKYYDPNDTTLKFVEGDDDMDFEYNDYKSRRAQMSCGHSVTPMSLTNWCHRLLDQGESRFVCGQSDCDAEWTYEEVCKMALLTPEEMEYFETKMFSSTAKDLMDVKACPGCKSSVVRTDDSNLRVFCTVCTADRRTIFAFCWQCLNEWKDPRQYSGRCGNDGCINKPLEILKTCPEIIFKNVRGVTGCPSTRACPTCGLLVVHNSEHCKNIFCPRCKVQFCFVCLRLSVVCGSYYITCSTGVAPRQTSIPVWKKK